MRARDALMLGMTLGLPATVLAQASGEAKAKRPSQAAASRLVVMPASGAFGAFFKLPAGFAAPLHTHTYDMKVVILSGTYIQAPEGKPEFRLGPGSYFMQPGGDYRHTTSCDQASDCVFFVEGKGKFDLKPVDAGKAPHR